MAILSADLLEVAPKSPAPIATVGNYVVAFNTNSSTTGLVPNGAFAVMDTTTETAKAYSGLTTSTSTPIQIVSATGHGGYAWAWLPDGSSLYRIDPATGGVTTFSTGSAFNNNGVAICCAANGYVCAFSSGSTSNQIKIWNISAGTLATLNTSGMIASSGVAEVGNYIYAQVTISGTSSAIRKFDPSGGGSFVAASGAAPAYTLGKGVSYGGYVWFQHTTGITRVDPTSFAFTTYSHTSITGGNYLSSTNLVLGSDNWLYGYGGSDYLIGFNPATGAFGKEALTPARGRRHSLAACNGKLWLPSGEPLT